MEYKCDYCSKIKSKAEYYKNNLSKCKECTKYESSINRINKNVVFKKLDDISIDLNNNNIILNDILISIKEVREEIKLIKSNINMYDKFSKMDNDEIVNKNIEKLNINRKNKKSIFINNDEGYEKI